MTDTPRTDAASRHREGLGLESGKVCSDFARELERDLAQRTAERDALAAEVAALKKNDPLAEMWRELEAYLPRANANGHGRSWKRMCSERTEEAAREESFNVAAAAAARDAAAWAADAMSAKQARANSAKDAIRRAKEAKP